MHDKTLAELTRSLDAGDFSSRELTQHLLGRIDRLDGELNSFITVTHEQALAAADAADAARAAGKAGTLTGLPLALKDIFCTQDVKTTAGSRMLDSFIAPYDATVVEKLKAAGTVSLGKTNMDEFAMGSSNENSHYGPVKNPGTSAPCRADRPAAAPLLWRRAWCRPRSAPIPAARFVSPRPSAASPGSSPPTARCRATA